MYSVRIRNIAKSAVPRMKPTMFAAVSVCSRKIENGNERILHAPLPADEREQQHRGGDEDADGLARAPAPAVALRDAENEERETRRDENRTRNVEALAVLVQALREQDRREDQRRDADRDVHEEDPLPRQEVDEDAAEEDACRRTDAADGAPGTERDVALATLREHRDEDRQRGRGEGGRAETLQRAERDQRRLTPREPAEQRAEREDQRSGHEDAPPAEEVGGASAQEEEPSEDERVGADHPLQVLLGEPEIELYRRQRDVDDRDVEDGHELHREDERECEPFLAVRADHENPPFPAFWHSSCGVSGGCYTNLLAIRKYVLSILKRSALHSARGQVLRPVLPDGARPRPRGRALVAAHRPRAPRGRPAPLLGSPCPARRLRHEHPRRAAEDARAGRSRPSPAARAARGVLGLRADRVREGSS